jgi:dipeptidyl-peptidase-4
LPDAGAFPRRHARTRGFTLGRPRGFAVGADGARVAFLRSVAGDDPVNRLWVLDLASGTERLVADPAALLGGSGRLKASPPVNGEDPGELPAAERARRERARERAGGIVAFGADRNLTVAAFALAGRLFVADLAAGGSGEDLPSPPVDSSAPPRELAGSGVLDPRVDPTGRRVAWVADRALHVAELDGGPPAAARLAGEDDPEVTWGLAEFVAAEEMDRSRGFWWAPDGRRLAVARVDTGAVQRFHLADPADPAAEPVRLPYPAAGTANAEVRLAVVGLDGGRVELSWDRAAFPYLAAVVWEPGGPLTLLVQARDQTQTRVLRADPDSGATSELAIQRDPAWVELVPGVPAWLDGRLVMTADDPGCDTRRLTVDGAPVTPPGLQIQEVVAVTGGAVLVAGSEEPTEVHLWRVAPGVPAERLTGEPGQHGAVAAGEVAVVTSASLDRDGTSTTVHRAGRPPVAIGSLAEPSGVRPRPRLLRAGPRELRAALLLPDGPFQAPLPVLLDPYGGPHHRQVLAARDRFLVAQWFADQGFAVLVTDGRGTPGRGPAWERAVHRDLAGPALDDQVEALHAVAARHPELDLHRVAIRGWSFGGYLAALAVLRRPEVFHAAVAGAPVSDWRLYDTHYTERYLGHPDRDPDAYRRSSLLADAAWAHPERPLLLVHGLADDNVVAAHTLRLSGRLLAAGRPHSVLPLPGVTHMAVQEAVAENLLHLQLRFLREALGMGR